MNKPLIWILNDVWEEHDYEIERLNNEGYEVAVTRLKDFDADLKKYAGSASVVMFQVGFIVDKALIDTLDNCKAIIALGMGYQNVDMETASNRGIHVSNIPDYCIEEVSDHTVAMMLHGMRRLSDYSEVVKSGSWDSFAVSGVKPIGRLTIGLLGFGRIAKRAAEKLKPFGAEIIAHDDFIPREIFDEYDVEAVSFEDLMQRSDHLSLHVPLTEDTKHIINADSLELMQDGAFIINTCRGGIIKEDNLIQAIESGKVGGAALDVLEQEPPDFSNPLLNRKEVLITPHAAYYSDDALKNLRIKACDKVIEAVETGTIGTALNHDKLK